ncbi:MAG: FdhF/YdeP family oxidoreductase [Burkholderiales bacterium]|nr:FdhF/YdeP family oxidoreductase [Burkholderiales bacterium]
MTQDEDVRIESFNHPAGGWTSVREVAHALGEAHIRLEGSRILLKQNKPDGFACVSCSWAKPADHHAAEFCEHGAKATAWELTTERCTPEFFAEHTLTELEGWSDLALECTGRLTAPMRWDAATDKYVEVSWHEAFEDIGRRLRELEPRETVFYTSGRASLETSFMYALMARMYGNNNLPDSSNMCHESTSSGLPKSIGVPVGTVQIEDFKTCDCIFIMGHNIGTNAPRMLHDLQECRERGVPILVFNPLKEPGLVRFANPMSPTQMLTPAETHISTQYHQLKAGGDLAALTGLCKALVALDDQARETGGEQVLDHAFIAEHTHGFEAFCLHLRQVEWPAIEQASGLTRAALESAAAVIGRAKRVIGVYGMGLTQHKTGVANVQMVANLLLLGGHMGVPGAGILPVRGHSNVQGQRTVGITEKPEKVPADKLKALFGIDVPKEKGRTTVETCEGLMAGTVKAIVSLGGNLLRAVPDGPRIEQGWRRTRLTVQIATKLNRSHVVHGEVAYLLPCLGRIEIDHQIGGEQAVSMEDSTGCMHGSRGVAEPASAKLRSEPAIVAGIAKATLEPNPRVPWDQWVADYSKVRKAIEQTYPEIFHDFEERMWQPGGFHRPLGACHREWKTPNGKANFICPPSLDEDDDMTAHGPDVIRLTTLRSFDQFNTTVYGNHDRFRGIHGTRHVLMMNEEDIARLGFADGQLVRATTAATDGPPREVRGLRIVRYDIPSGCAAGYFPELNPLVPLWHHATESQVPAYKSIPIRLSRM